MLEPKICADLDIINPRRTCAARVMVVVVIGTITTIRKSPLSNKITQEVSPFTICSGMREIFRKVICTVLTYATILQRTFTKPIVELKAWQMHSERCASLTLGSMLSYLVCSLS